MDDSHGDMSSSDLLLVTDGELPNPPVSDSVLSKLEGLRRQTGMEVHGLLVGRKESESLNALCTEVHDFFGHDAGIHEAILPHREVMGRSHTALLLRPSTKRVGLFHGRPQNARFGFSLRATSQPHDEDRLPDAQITLGRRAERASGKRRRRFDEEHDWELFDDEPDWEVRTKGRVTPSSKENKSDQLQIQNTGYVKRVEDAVVLVQEAATDLIEKSKLETKGLERTWDKTKAISEAIDFVERGLVERDLEARLVVLGMLSQEHVLFIGPPGRP